MTQQRRAATPRGEAARPDDYVPRGGECAYANLKLLSRVIGTVYDDSLRPSGLRASQFALLWAIAAAEPVDMGRLGYLTLTDQTTLSRTVEKLRLARLVSARPGDDRRQKILQLTRLGRTRFAQALPLWELAQQRAAALMPLEDVRRLARQVRRAARAGGIDYSRKAA